MSTFLHQHHAADPNAKKPVQPIQAHDIISLDAHPCLISDPPRISHLEGLSGGGYEDPAEEKLVLVRGRSVADGEDYDQLFGVDRGEVECFVDRHKERFVDRHKEREWLVVCCSFSFLSFSFLFFSFLSLSFPSLSSLFFARGGGGNRGERERLMELDWSGVTNENLAILFP